MQSHRGNANLCRRNARRNTPDLHRSGPFGRAHEAWSGWTSSHRIFWKPFGVDESARRPGSAPGDRRLQNRQPVSVDCSTTRFWKAPSVARGMKHETSESSASGAPAAPETPGLDPGRLSARRFSGGLVHWLLSPARSPLESRPVASATVAGASRHSAPARPRWCRPAGTGPRSRI
jgi:hypothetical protein